MVHVSAGRTNRPDRVDQVDVKMKAVIMIIKHFGHLKMGKSSSFVIVFFCIGFLLPDWFLSANKTLPEWLNPMHFFIRQKAAYYSVSTFLRMNREKSSKMRFSPIHTATKKKAKGLKRQSG